MPIAWHPNRWWNIYVSEDVPNINVPIQMYQNVYS